MTEKKKKKNAQSKVNVEIYFPKNSRIFVTPFRVFNNMAATLFSDLEFSTGGLHGNGGQSQKVIEDSRALQVALELSMLYMNGEQRQQKADNSMSGGPSAMDHGSQLQQSGYNSGIPTGFPEEPRNKKSQNMTECVPVPSSEHVAEIVGRQGKNVFSFCLNFILLTVYMELLPCIYRAAMFF